VIGGCDSTCSSTDALELISLDPKNNPVPAQLKNLNKFPTNILGGGGAMLTQGQFTRLLIKFSNSIATIIIHVGLTVSLSLKALD
jgi:hypothetical protein